MLLLVAGLVAVAPAVSAWAILRGRAPSWPRLGAAGLIGAAVGAGLWWAARALATRELFSLRAGFVARGSVDWATLAAPGRKAAVDAAALYLGEARFLVTLPDAALGLGLAFLAALWLRRLYADAQTRRYQGSGSTTSPEVSK